jgi:hypothetical protein
VAAGVEDCVEVARAAGELLQGQGVLPQGLVVVEEADGDGVLLGELDGGGIERGDAALGRDDGDLDVLAGEDMVRVGELGLCL